jgi:tetratricopeptide (TPR) repeat protein
MIKKPFAMFGAGVLALLMCSSGFGRQATEFTTADLEKMVQELSKYLPDDPRMTYPVLCVVEKNEDVNAYASPFFAKDAPKGQKPRANMTVFTGLFKWMNNDVRLVRAVVAHELAHLSKKHVGTGMKAADLDLIFTRQQEYEADATGAAVLEKCGYSRKDMTDMLLRLGEVGRTAPASLKVMGDHADCQRRAANVDRSNLVLRSMVSFTNGEAYMDVRAFNKAKEQFDKSVEQAPTFYEAKFNAAQASLLFYYDILDPVVREAWYQPDFGPSMLLPLRYSTKGGKLTVLDEANFAEALKRIRAVIEAEPKRQEGSELLGLALVLDPNGNSSNISEGIRTLEKSMTTAVTADDRLRIVNNLAIGYQRQGNIATAIDKMFAEQKKSNKYNGFLAANLGSQALPDKIKGADATLAVNVLYTYLSNTNPQAIGYAKVETNFNSLCQKFNLKTKEITRRGVPICTAFSIVDGGRTVFLLDPFENYYKKIGALEAIQGYSNKYAGLLEFVWQGGNFTILTDKGFSEDDKNDGKITPELVAELEVIRVTSYNPGAYLEMRSADAKVDVAYRVTVGMTLEEFNRFLNSESGEAKQLIHNAAMEEWIYFHGLNFGIYVKDKKVAGITVCPLKAD